MALLGRGRSWARGTLPAGAIDVIPLCNNAGDAITDIAVGLARTATVLRLLATAADIGRLGQDRLPARLATTALNITVQILVDEQLRAAHTDTLQNIQDLGEELDEIDRAGELEVAKVTRARVIRLTTAAASLSVVQNTHTRIKEAADTGLIAIVGASIRNLNHRATLNLVGAEDAELNTYNRLNIRIWTYDSCRHSPLKLLGVSIGGCGGRCAQFLEDQ